MFGFICGKLFLELFLFMYAVDLVYKVRDSVKMGLTRP